MDRPNLVSGTHRERIVTKMRQDGVSEAEITEMLDSWEITQNLIPADFDKMRESKTCYFCAESPQEKDGFAHTILAHKEPTAYKQLLGFGKARFQAEIGSLLPVYIPICKHCRSEFRKVQWIRSLITAGSMVLAIAAIVITHLLPGLELTTKTQLGIYAGAAALVVFGLSASAFTASRYVKVNSNKVHFNVFDIDLMHRMQENGWFLFQDNSSTSMLSFSSQTDDFGKVFED